MEILRSSIYFFRKTVLENLDFDKSEEWKKEYARIGKQYAKWASLFVIFGAPLIMLSEAPYLTNSYILWLGFRLFSSVATGVGLVFFLIYQGKIKNIHEYLFLVMAYSLYINSGFWADCESGQNNFLFGQLCILVPTVLITLLRPVLYLVNFFVHCILILLVFQFTCNQDMKVFMTSFQFFTFLILAVSAYLFASYRYYLIRKNFIVSTLLRDALDDAECKRKKSDDLLLNILPAEVAQELKTNGKSEAKQYDQVTIIFADFVNFTGISEELTPQELVKNIHENFTAFDDIIGKHGLEKIKTIGDAYLAVAGLPVKDPNHAQNVVRAALEIREYMVSSNNIFKIRIGINSGTVVAGIVGVKKFAYDIWGDAVNVAARLEQESEIGKINISKITYELVKDDFDCIYRGKIAAKNKGEIDMYFLVAEKI